MRISQTLLAILIAFNVLTLVLNAVSTVFWAIQSKWMLAAFSLTTMSCSAFVICFCLYAKRVR